MLCRYVQIVSRLSGYLFDNTDIGSDIISVERFNDGTLSVGGLLVEGLLHMLLGNVIGNGINLGRINSLNALLEPVVCKGVEDASFFGGIVLEHVLVHCVGEVDE